ncbi:protein TASOR 2 [Ahaetulla prasina]|uniref:protein TASOR 2 n=1 Tax=Ahaetulla prasina TaxID=499056 RepID=UPI002648F28A|nr:protein TASOR 2 [Ahaetulla prasina]XP_058047903.1 protein TASOR 2 [Ahaetulla prasina]
MLPLGYKSLAEHEMKVLYRAWEGQLFVQNRRVCNIVLRSPSQASIPAQLPAKLEFKYIVRISELRKKLPEAAFEKNSYSNNEVCCQQLSFRLYQVEILDESERKDQLIGSMKEKNLALVKYLNDRGILLFLTSSVLAKETDAEANDLGCLQALFLFPSPEPKLLRATDWKREEGRSEAPQQLPLILPLLQQALAGAAKNPNPSQFSPSALVKLHMEEFANVDQCSVLSCDNTASLPLPSKLSSETPKGAPVDDTRSPSSFSDLAVYLSDPESYALEVSSASACLKGRCRLSDGCTGLNLDPSRSDRADGAGETGKAPFEGPSRAAASKSSPAGERSLQWTKRKSSRILGASSKKKWSPLKMYCVLESSKKKTKEKEKSKKKKKKKKKKLPKEAMTLNIPLAKDPGSPADPKKPTLKLKNILNPLRRKRGAEVLSAEFIHGPRSVSLEGATGSSAGPATEEKKPRLNMATKLKDVDKMDARGPTPRKNIRGVPSEKQRTEAASVERDVAAPDTNQAPSGGEECDSHALNLLADLALSSCNSPLDGNSRRDFGRFRPSREHRLHRGKFLHKSSDHEYHRATKKRKGAFLPGQSSRSSLWPAKETGRDKDWPLTAKDRSAVNLIKKKKARANLAKTSLALPSEPGDLSDSSVIISLEHSYASPVSEMPRKATPRSPNSRNGVKQDKPGPLVGKVLPFQHQQNSCQVGKPVTNHLPPARSVALATRLRVDFSNSRQVTSRDKTVQVTFQWEAEYLFDLDSKYTNNSLEKTIIRAVHGPWDESLSDDMEEMKLILHMWLALFYSKPVQALTVRKVVEHSNPAKYVSLNSLVDPLEPMDDGGGPYGLEKCPASSLPVAVRIPAEGGEDGSVSPSEKLLPGNRLSSADSLEDESPLTKLEETKDLPQKEELPHPPLKSVDEVVEAEPKEQTSLHPVLPIENPPGVDERVNPPICQTKTDRSQETMSVETSPNDASVPTGPPVEGSRNQQPIASTQVALSVTNRGTDVGSSSEEVKKDNLPAGGPNPRMWKEVELKADVNSRKPTNPVNEVGNQPRLCTDERDGEGVDLGSIDLVLSKSNDADMEIQDMDLVSEDEGEPAESSVKGREEIDGMSDVSSSGQGPLSSRASSPDASSGHPTEFPGVQEAAVGPSSSSVSPNQMGLMDMVPQQATSIHPVAVDEKMVGSTSSSISPNQRELVDTVPQQKASFQLVTVDEKMVGSTSSSISPNQMELLDTVPQQKASFQLVTVDEKMVGSTSSSISPNQMELVDTVPQQKASFQLVTVDEKMVGSTSSSISPNQMGLMDMVPQQKASFHLVIADEKMVESTSSSISPNQMELLDTVPQQKASFQLVTVDEKMIGSTSSSISPNQMELLDTVPQQKASFHPVTVDEKMVGSASNSVSPNQMELLDTVPQQKASFHPVTVDEKMVGSAMDPTSPKQTDEVENSHDEAVLANSVSTEASGDFSNDLATQDGPFYQSPQEPVESPRVPKQVDVVDLSSVSQEDGRIYSSCLPSWQASPVHRVSDEEPSRIQEDHPENPLYHIFQNPMGLIEDISQDSTDLADPAVLHLCEPNKNFCVNLVPNSISTRQESVENQDSLVAFAQHLPLTKEMDLVESPEGDHPASPVHQETSDEAATLQDNSDVKLDLLEDSSIPQEKDVIHPTENVLGPVNEQRSAESDLGTQEEQKINQGEKIPVDSQPAKEYPSSESHDAESEASFKSETCLDLENIRDSSAREEEEDGSPDDGVEKPTVSTTAVAEEVHVLMNELVDTVCATIAQSEEMRALKCLDWIDSAMLECVTPPGSDDEGCPTDQDSHADVKWVEECLEESSSFDEQEEDLQARVEGRGELDSSSNENATSDPGDASEKAELQGNDATSAATETFSSCGTSQAELDTASPKSRCSWLETTESPDDNSAKVDDYGVSTLEKVGQTEASPEEPNCDREDCPRGEDVGNTSFVPAKCQEDSLAEEPGSLVDRDSKEAPEDCEEEAQEEAKGCLGSLEDPLPDERTQMSTSSSGTDTDWEDEYLTVDDGQDPCVDWYPTRTIESWYQPRFKASPSIESELTRSSGPGNETCKDGDWVSSEASQKTSDAGSLKRNVPFGLKKDCLWSRDMDHKPEPFKDYINFSITKKHKEKSRTFHTFSKEHNPFSRDLGSINSWNRNWDFLSDPIQNILDMESLQFHCRIQELLKRSQRSTSCVLPSKKVPCQGIAEGLPSRTVSEETIAKFPTRSKSPLLVTVVNPNLRTGHRYSDIYGPFPASLDPFVPRSQGGLSPKYPFPSLRLQKLTYHKLNSFSRDISSVLEDFAEFSRAMTSESVRMGNPGRDLTATSGKAGEIRYPPQPPTPLVYEDLLAELRNALHFQLKNVAQEASRKPFSFYLMETEDDPFFGRVKNLLKKGGHSEVDLLQFCKGSGVEMENLLVIVRNEDIFLHIHKVPSLLHLKRCPNVTFAGVDSPEDPLEHTYQELFHSGGFVVSDDNVLEGMTVGELKDVIKTLEKLNSHGRWKWFLHYRESKKLKEDARGDLAANTKESVLKSCQVANMTEVLHYHKCDSKSCTRFERFNCLLNLQIQHITKRFAVFLTENASANWEALEDKGIFSLNISNFIATAQGLVAPFGSGFW